MIAGSSLDKPENSSFVLSQLLIWFFFPIGLIFPFLPIYFSEIGLSESKIAILLGLQPFSVLFASQIWSYIADTWLNRKITLALMSMFAVIFALSFLPVRAFYLLAILMICISTVAGPRMAIVTSLVLDGHDGERRFGLLRPVGSLAFITAGYFGAKIIDLPNSLGTAWIFPLCALANFIFVLALIPLKEAPRRTAAAKAASPAPSFLKVQGQLLAKPVVRIFFVFLLLSQLTHNVSLSFQSLLIKSPKVDGGNSDVALALIIGAFAEILIFLAFQRVIARVRLMPLFFLSTVALTLRWAVIYFFPVLWVILLSNVLHLFTFGMMHICAVIFIHREVPRELQSSAQSLVAIVHFALSGMLGQFMSSAFFRFGTVHDWYGFAAVFTLIALPFWWWMKGLYEREHQVSGFWVRA